MFLFVLMQAPQKRGLRLGFYDVKLGVLGGEVGSYGEA